MPHPIEPEERPALKSLGAEFGKDVEEYSPEPAHGQTSTAEALRSKMQSSTLSLEWFWANQRTVLGGVLTAQNDENISKIDELNKSLEKAGVGDEAFSQLLENWEHLTSPFNAEYDATAIHKSGESVLDAVKKIRSTLDSASLSNSAAHLLDPILTAISEQIRDRAQALGNGQVVTPASAENRANQLETRVDELTKMGRDAIQSEIDALNEPYAKYQKKCTDLTKIINTNKAKMDPAKRDQAVKDLDTIAGKLNDPRTTPTMKTSLTKLQSKLQQDVKEQDRITNLIQSTQRSLSALQAPQIDAAGVQRLQTRLQKFDQAVADRGAELRAGTTNSTDVLKAARQQLNDGLNVLGAQIAGTARTKLAAGAFTPDPAIELKSFASLLNGSNYDVDAIASSASDITATIEKCIAVVDAVVGTVAQGEKGKADLRAAIRDQFVAQMTAIASDVQRHFSYLVNKGFFASAKS